MRERAHHGFVRRGVHAGSDVDDELNNLKLGEVLFPPDVDFERGQRVVVVHDNVYEKVNGDGDPLHCRVLIKLYPAEEEGGGVVVLVQEDDRLLPQHEDHCVKQLVPLDEVIQIV